MKAIMSSATALSVSAGFLGGLVSQRLFAPATANAQLIVPPPTRPEKRPIGSEVDAQRFVLVDSAGTVHGEFKLNGDNPEIVLYDKEGRVGWRATPSHIGFQPVAVKP